MTTRIGGWVPRWAFNTLFKAPLIDANVHEAGEFKIFAEKLAAKLEVERKYANPEPEVKKKWQTSYWSP